MPKIPKMWKPIDTKNELAVKEEPLKARVQSFRNGWLILKNKISATKWTRIEVPKITTFTKYEQVQGCLGLLSENLSKTKNKDAALGEIQLTSF
jgi:hypothetical protein